MKRKRETIRFGGKTAQFFGIIDVRPKSNKTVYDVEVEKINEDEKQIELFLKVKDEKNKEFKKEIIISKATISKKEATIVGWCYVTLIDEDNKNRVKARYYLKKATKNDTWQGFFENEEMKSALPYYLLSRNNLYEDSGIMLQMLYRASKCSDTFSDFYRELFRHEKDKLRKIDIAKTAIKKFPKADNEYFIDFIVNDLYKKNKWKEARSFFESAISKIPKKEWVNGYSHLKITAVKLLVSQKDFPSAEKIIKGKIFNKSTDNLLKGKFYFEKGELQKAINYFKDAIVSTTHDTDDTQASYYYLLACYSKIKNLTEIQDIIEHAKLCHQELVVSYPLDFVYKEFAEKTLRSILKLKIDELLKAKIKGLLVYIQTSTLPTPEDETLTRILTQKEKSVLKEAELTIREVLEYYPNDKLFNATYSNILYFKKDYDNSLRYKLRAIEGIESSGAFISLQVSINNASDEFLNEYADVVKVAVASYGISIEDYIHHQFNEDVAALYEKKNFSSIKKLYDYIKPNINNLSSLGESEYYGTWYTGLFELGYALSECGDEKEAKTVYEAYLESHADSSSALNNLAIIYEKERNATRAKSLIKKAKEKDKDDEIIERNYNRIFSNKEKGVSVTHPKQQTQRQQKSKKISQTVIENGMGYLLLDDGRIQVGSAKNIPFKLLDALCPFGIEKATNAIFNMSSTDRSKFKNETLSLEEKQDILRTRIKDLQGLLRKKKVKVSLVFNHESETVFLRRSRR